MSGSARLALALPAAVLIAGCGGGSQPRSDTEQVTTTVRSYLRLQATGDAGQACALLTAAGQQQLTAYVAKQASKSPFATGALTCEQAIGIARLAGGSALMTAMRDATIRNVRVTGTTATAEIQGSGDVGRRSVRLVKAGGDWRIQAVPGLGG